MSKRTSAHSEPSVDGVIVDTCQWVRVDVEAEHNQWSKLKSRWTVATVASGCTAVKAVQLLYKLGLPGAATWQSPLEWWIMVIGDTCPVNDVGARWMSLDWP